MGRIHPYELVYHYHSQPQIARSRAQALRVVAMDWFPVLATLILTLVILGMALTLVR